MYMWENWHSHLESFQFSYYERQMFSGILQAPVSFQSVEYNLAEVHNLHCDCSCPERFSQGKHVIPTGGSICHGRLVILHALCELENQEKNDFFKLFF